MHEYKTIEEASAVDPTPALAAFASLGWCNSGVFGRAADRGLGATVVLLFTSEVALVSLAAPGVEYAWSRVRLGSRPGT